MAGALDVDPGAAYDRHGTEKFLRRGPNRPNAGVDVKIHSTPSRAPRC